MREDEKPLEILPGGRTLEDQERIDRKKAQARGGWHGCLFMAVLFALFAVYVAGWMSGKHS